MADPAELVGEIYEATAMPEAWPGVLQRIAAWGGGGAATLLTRSSDAFTGWIGSPEVDDPDGHAYMRSEAALRSATTPRLIGANHAGFLADHQLFTEAEFAADPMVTSWSTPKGFHHCAATAVHVPNGDVAIVHLNRHVGQPRYEDKTLARLDELRPHLARAAMLSARWGLERLRAAVQALEALGLPAAVLAHNGKVLIANELIQAVGGHVAWAARDRLRLGDPAAAGLLEARLGGPWHAEIEACSLPVKAMEGAPAAVAHLAPLWRQARDLFNGGAALLVITPLGGGAPSAALIQGLFDLTPAEARVASNLVEGLDVTEIARRSSVSVATVRAQVRGILGKAGARRQAEFIALFGAWRPEQGGVHQFT